jgi:signal peptidase II
MTTPLPATARAASGWRWLPLTVVVIVLDQLSKAWMVHHFSLFERVRVLPVLDIILTYNTGAAFSFLSDAAGWQRWVFVVLALGISALLIGWLRRLRADTQGWLACGLALIVGGALGNMLDRLLHGRVVDFILAHWGAHLFPAFNVADSAITVGAGLVILDALLESRPRPAPGS